MRIQHNKETGLIDLYVGDCKFCCFESEDQADLGLEMLSGFILGKYKPPVKITYYQQAEEQPRRLLGVA